MTTKTPTSLEEALAIIAFQERKITRLEDKVDQLEEKIADLDLVIEDLENEKAELQGELEEAVEYDILDDDEYEDIEERVFLRDIGLDPDRLPTSVGDRMMLRDRLQERPS